MYQVFLLEFIIRKAILSFITNVLNKNIVKYKSYKKVLTYDNKTHA